MNELDEMRLAEDEDVSGDTINLIKKHKQKIYGILIVLLAIYILWNVYLLGGYNACVKSGAEGLTNEGFQSKCHFEEKENISLDFAIPSDLENKEK